MKQERKQKPIAMSEIIVWVLVFASVCMFAAIGLFVTIKEIFN